MQYRVEFIRPSDKYFPGDRAGFSLPVCQRFVEAGVAVWIDSPPNGNGEKASTHMLSAAGVRELVAATEDTDGLRVLWDSERSYPGLEGQGRPSALDAIERRCDQLGGDLEELRAGALPEFTPAALVALKAAGVAASTYAGEASGKGGKVTKNNATSWLASLEEEGEDEDGDEE